MSRDALIRTLAELIAGLQAPNSLGGPRLLGTAHTSYETLHHELVGFGWTNADELESALRARLLPATS